MFASLTLSLLYPRGMNKDRNQSVLNNTIHPHSGGGLDVNQCAPGDISWFNMWNYAMNFDQVNELTCSSKGNVASWETLDEYGTRLGDNNTYTCLGKS